MTTRTRPAAPPAGDCAECGRPMYRNREDRPSPVAVRTGAHGKCSTCYQRDLREGRTPVRDHRGRRVAKPPSVRALTRSLHREAWVEQAACLEVNPELFFYVDSEHGRARKARDEAAKAICATCPVIDHCLQWALDACEENGVWGGLTEDERAALLRRRRGVAS